jgi:uncharacterized iron-regulated protein
MKIILFSVVLMLSGCVSERATLTNTEGQQLHCDHWGFGIIGAPAAMAMHASCMKKAHAAGFAVAPQPNGT